MTQETLTDREAVAKAAWNAERQAIKAKHEQAIEECEKKLQGLQGILDAILATIPLEIPVGRHDYNDAPKMTDLRCRATGKFTSEIRSLLGDLLKNQVSLFAGRWKQSLRENGQRVLAPGDCRLDQLR